MTISYLVTLPAGAAVEEGHLLPHDVTEEAVAEARHDAVAGRVEQVGPQRWVGPGTCCSPHVIEVPFNSRHEG